MADAAEYDQLAAEVAGAEARERALTEVVRLIVHVRPREGAVRRTVNELQARADAVRNG
jgi:hypothetical protein